MFPAVIITITGKTEIIDYMTEIKTMTEKKISMSEAHAVRVKAKYNLGHCIACLRPIKRGDTIYYVKTKGPRCRKCWVKFANRRNIRTAPLGERVPKKSILKEKIYIEEEVEEVEVTQGRGFKELEQRLKRYMQ